MVVEAAREAAVRHTRRTRLRARGGGVHGGRGGGVGAGRCVVGK
jgi:hypothetical protein